MASDNKTDIQTETETKKLPLFTPPAGPRKITADEIAEHADESSAWMSIHGKVYDLTKFANFEHPGG